MAVPYAVRIVASFLYNTLTHWQTRVTVLYEVLYICIPIATQAGVVVTYLSLQVPVRLGGQDEPLFLSPLQVSALPFHVGQLFTAEPALSSLATLFVYFSVYHAKLNVCLLYTSRCV